LDQANFAGDTLVRLLGVLANNLQNCREFAVEFDACFGSLTFSAEEATRWDAAIFFKTMSVAIAKWFLAMAQEMNNELSISSLAGYQVNYGAPYLDMASLVLRFVPLATIGPDPIGLAVGTPPIDDECMQSVPFPKRASAVMDIDKALAKSPTQWGRFRDATGELLEQARYSAECYRVWADDDLVRNGRKSPQDESRSKAGNEAG
jgi:hypothetical protein